MTEKQEKILQSARELFSKEGFKSTSTSKVAAHAGVSEGLIFRHYKNKEGLLDAIIQEGEDKLKVVLSDIIFEEDPKAVISKTLELTTKLGEDPAEFEFWKLQYKIKWETERYAEHKMEPLRLALSQAFGKLGYESPDEEALLVLVTLDGLATRFALQKGFDFQSLIDLMKRKYSL
jgi:AcrR family transcriptional regulator